MYLAAVARKFAIEEKQVRLEVSNFAVFTYCVLPIPSMAPPVFSRSVVPDYEKYLNTRIEVQLNGGRDGLFPSPLSTRPCPICMFTTRPSHQLFQSPAC
jgi:hypothetical protein